MDIIVKGYKSKNTCLPQLVTQVLYKYSSPGLRNAPHIHVIKHTFNILETKEPYTKHFI